MKGLLTVNEMLDVRAQTSRYLFVCSERGRSPDRFYESQEQIQKATNMLYQKQHVNDRQQ